MIIMQLLFNSLVAGSIYALTAFGFTLIYGTMRFFNMAYGITLMVGAYSFYVCYDILELHFLISLSVAIIFTPAVMLVLDRLCYYKLRVREAPGWAIIIVSMSVAIIGEAVISMIFGSEVRMVRKSLPTSFTILNASITPTQLMILASSVALMIGFSLLLHRTKIGQIIRAVSNDRKMAIIVGIDIERIFLLVILLGSALASIAGVLTAFETDVEPYMSHPALLKAITASIIGGVGNIKGAMLAGYLIGFLENVGVWSTAGGWKDAIPLVLIVLFILIRPSAFGIEQNR
jgi:branched-chain amino acid transport system permease protein